MSQASSIANLVEAMPIDVKENQWGYARRLRFIRETIASAFPDRAASSLSLLDIGCGNGAFVAVPLAQDGYQVTGVDIHQQSIDHAKALVGAAPNGRFICGDIEKVPGRFDVVVLSEVLEHVVNPRDLLESSAARLNRNGILIVTIPNGYGEFEIDSWLYRKLRIETLVRLLKPTKPEAESSTDNHDCGHIQFFTVRRLLEMFADCALEVFRSCGSSLLAGPLVAHTLAHLDAFIRWNVAVVDILPMQLASGWYFALRRRHTSAV